MNTTITRMIYRCLLIAVVCCVLPLAGAAVNYTVTVEKPHAGATFTVTTQDGVELSYLANTVADGTVLTLTGTYSGSDYAGEMLYYADGNDLYSPSYTVTGDVTLSTKAGRFKPLDDFTITQPIVGGTFTVTSQFGEVKPDDDIYPGMVLTLVPSAEPGYRFVKFTLNSEEITSPYTTTLNRENHVLTAVFEQIHTVTIEQPHAGATFTVTTQGGVELSYGTNTVADVTVLTLTGTCSGPGYEGEMEYFADGTKFYSPSYTVTGDVTLSAKGIRLKPLDNFTITQPFIGGTFTVTSQFGEVKPDDDIYLGMVLALVPSAEPGYRFVKFTLNSEEITSPYTIPRNRYEDLVLTAVFEQIHTVTVIQPVDGGTFTATSSDGNTLSDGDNIIAHDTELTLTAIPANGYRLVSFTADDAEVTNPYVVTDGVTISAKFELIPTPPTPPVNPDDNPPLVYYTVTLPIVEGAITDPVAGAYEVESWSSFRFYLNLDKGYDKSEPVVTTSRDETITPRTSDGAYIVKYIRQPVEIHIDGIVKNSDPVANETIATDVFKVWATKGKLHISTITDQTVQVYNLTGLLVKQADISIGETLWQLPSGIYIVQIAGVRQKVVL